MIRNFFRVTILLLTLNSHGWGQEFKDKAQFEASLQTKQEALSSGLRGLEKNNRPKAQPFC